MQTLGVLELKGFARFVPMAHSNSFAEVLWNAAREIRWDKFILQRELKLLLQEQQHLEVKRKERELTSWELERLERVCEETRSVLQLFKQLELHATS